MKNQQPNSERNSENKVNQEKEKELLLENSPFESCNNSGGVSQETTSKPVNNLKDTNSTSQETSRNRRWIEITLLSKLLEIQIQV